jgi:hypothetical protein
MCRSGEEKDLFISNEGYSLSEWTSERDVEDVAAGMPLDAGDSEVAWVDGVKSGLSCTIEGCVAVNLANAIAEFVKSSTFMSW